jgi:hypothetical protein
VAEDDAPLDPDRIDLDRVVDEIREAVAARTAAGEYSAAIDDELRSRVVARPPSADTGARAAAAAAIASVVETSTLDPARVDTTSSVPGGAAVHRLAGKIAGRQVAELATQFNRFGAALVPALEAITALAADAADDQVLLHELDTVQDRLAAVERSLRHLHGATDSLLTAQRDLEARVARLEHAAGSDEH